MRGQTSLTSPNLRLMISKHGQRFARYSPVFMSPEPDPACDMCVFGCRWILELMILLAGLASDAEVQVGVGVHNSQSTVCGLSH